MGSSDHKSTVDPSVIDEATAIDPAYLRRLRELKLELIKTRNQAEAARLDARAAELELHLSRLAKRIDRAEDAIEGRLEINAAELSETVAPDAELDRLLDQTADARATSSTVDQRGRLPAAASSRRPAEPPPWRKVRAAAVYQPDASESIPVKPHRQPVDDADAEPQRDETPRIDEVPQPAIQSWQQLRRRLKDHAAETGPRPTRPADVPPQLNTESQSSEGDRSQRKRRPLAWAGSAAAHGVLLLILAFWTLASTPPQDQIALAGAVSEDDEVAVETLSIESEPIQPSVDEPESEPVEVQTVEFSEVGELPFTATEIDLPLAAAANPLAESLRGDAQSASAALSMSSDSEMKMEFCGIEGGGNHFVYLVDSSGSMGDAFQSARRELLRSIELLKPDQRFYVIFFDAQPDYMRLTSPDRDEPRSVYATAENKAAVRRWAMGIEMDRGRAPYDALPFAIDLAPDVIFLLSDGEFPERIEALLQDINRVDNLFGDSGPISIVHTIGYHSREGEQRMRRIAQQNGGRYRHVPRP